MNFPACAIFKSHSIKTCPIEQLKLMLKVTTECIHSLVRNIFKYIHSNLYFVKSSYINFYDESQGKKLIKSPQKKISRGSKSIYKVPYTKLTLKKLSIGNLHNFYTLNPFKKNQRNQAQSSNQQ